MFVEAAGGIVEEAGEVGSGVKIKGCVEDEAAVFVAGFGNEVVEVVELVVGEAWVGEAWEGGGDGGDGDAMVVEGTAGWDGGVRVGWEPPIPSDMQRVDW